MRETKHRSVALGLAFAVFALLAISSASGCKGCREKETTLEAMYGNHYAVDSGFVELARATGSTCTRNGTVRNASGVAIGERYLCTRCD